MSTIVGNNGDERKMIWGGGGPYFLPTADARALYIGIRDSIPHVYGNGKALYPLTRLMELKFNK